VIFRLTRKEIGQRSTSAAEVAAELQAIADGRGDVRLAA
jgi:hypothetical protein